MHLSMSLYTGAASKAAGRNIVLVEGVRTPFLMAGTRQVVNPLHPNISIHILHTLLYTFPSVLTRRIWLTIKDS